MNKYAHVRLQDDFWEVEINRTFLTYLIYDVSFIIIYILGFNNYVVGKQNQKKFDLLIREGNLLFNNKEDWSSTGKTYQDAFYLSDHAPVSATLNFP